MNAEVAIQPGQAPFRRIKRSNALPAPHFRYSPAIQVGSEVYVSGMVGIDSHSGSLAASTAAEQTRQIFRNFQALCHEQGWPLDRLVVARVYCANEGSSEGMNEAWNEFFADIAPPARTFTVVKALPLGAAVEIEFQLSL